MKINIVTLILLAVVVGCVTSRQPTNLPSRPAGFAIHSSRSETPKLCAAIRGNGELVMAHFAALAALSERFGPFDGLAGGSSASISSFIYESILQNPLVWDCPNCTRQQLGIRVALLLKSIWEYLSVLQNTEEARALIGLQRLLSTAQDKSISSLMESNIPAKIMTAISQMNDVFDSPEIGDLVNPELSDMLSPLKVAFRTFDARQAFDSIRSAGKFNTNDPNALFRPGVLNFPLLARKIGRIGNFYAGYGKFYPRDRMKAFIDSCAPRAAGLTWHELAGNHPECVTEAHDIIDGYRSKLLTNEEDIYSRVQDPIGMSAHVLITTSILRGAQLENFEKRLQHFRDGDTENTPFNVFSEMLIGYWGNPRDLARVEQGLRARDDIKSKKMFSLDEASWATALSYSPAEPGLARLRRIGKSSLISAAGWSDLAPTLALRAMGCQQVLYITRKGEESKFARGVARSMGMSAEEEKALYDTGDPKSALSQSIAEADGVWCTNWDGYEVWQGEDLERDSYRATLLDPHRNKIPGCGVGPRRRGRQK